MSAVTGKYWLPPDPHTIGAPLLVSTPKASTRAAASRADGRTISGVRASLKRHMCAVLDRDRHVHDDPSWINCVVSRVLKFAHSGHLREGCPGAAPGD
jgi:hypothetical protein